MFKIVKTEVKKVSYTDDISKYGSWDKYRQARDAKGIIYVWPQGEKIMDNLLNRRSRPYNDYKREVVPQVLEAMGLPPDTKIRWSQKAGCSCGCSPGFILDEVRGHRCDVTVEMDD